MEGFKLVNGIFQNIAGFGRVGVQVLGVDRLDRVLQALYNKNKNNNPVLRAVGMKMKTMIRSNFVAQENADGSKWEPLSEYTKAKRAEGDPSLGRDPLILRDTGNLYRSIAFQALENAVIAGSNVKYGPKHQLGEGVPVRQFLYIRDSGIDELTRFITNELIVAALGH